MLVRKISFLSQNIADFFNERRLPEVSAEAYLLSGQLMILMCLQPVHVAGLHGHQSSPAASCSDSRAHRPSIPSLWWSISGERRRFILEQNERVVDMEQVVMALSLQKFNRHQQA